MAARFPVVIDLPRYTPGQLTAIFATLADEAGLTLTGSAAQRAAAVLSQADGQRPAGNARLAVRLLDHAAARQARRITAVRQNAKPDALRTIRTEEIPGHLPAQDPSEPAPGYDDRPGMYL